MDITKNAKPLIIMAFFKMQIFGLCLNQLIFN